LTTNSVAAAAIAVLVTAPTVSGHVELGELACRRDPQRFGERQRRRRLSWKTCGCRCSGDDGGADGEQDGFDEGDDDGGADGELGGTEGGYNDGDAEGKRKGSNGGDDGGSDGSRMVLIKAPLTVRRNIMNRP
jgi:hypothetical protein